MSGVTTTTRSRLRPDGRRPGRQAGSAGGAYPTAGLFVRLAAACGLAFAPLHTVGARDAGPAWLQVMNPPVQGSVESVADRPLEGPLPEPVSPRFVVEHRTALHGRLVTVHGIVVSPAMPDAGAGSRGDVRPGPLGHPQPRVVLAQTSDPERDRRYDLTVLLPEGHAGYARGQRIDVRGTVDGNRQAVVVTWRD